MSLDRVGAGYRNLDQTSFDITLGFVWLQIASVTEFVRSVRTLASPIL